MEKLTRYSFLADIHLPCLKNQLENLFILILKSLFGLAIIYFNIFSATGTEENPANPVLSTSHNSSYQDGNDSAINIGWDQKIGRGFPKELWNKAYDAKEHLLSLTTNSKLQKAINSLWLELEKKILSDNFSLSQAIDLLKSKISKQTINPYARRAAIYIMRELLITYSLPDHSEALQLIDFLVEIISIETISPYVKDTAIHIIGELSIKYSFSQSTIFRILIFLQEKLPLEQINNHTRSTIIQVIGTILEQYSLPESNILQALNQIKEHLFHISKYTKADVLQVTGILLKRVSDTEKQKLIFWVTNHLEDENWKNRVSTLKILNEFLKQKVLSDPNNKKQITLLTKKRLLDTNWEVQKEAILILGALIIQQDILWEPNERKEIAFRIADQMASPEWEVQEAIIQVSGELLKRTILSPFEKSEMVYKITLPIFNDKKLIRKTTSKTMKSLWTDNDFPLPEKIKIIPVLAMKLSDASKGKGSAINVLQAAKKAGLPLDFDVIDKVTDIVADPSPLGNTAEAFVRESLKDVALSDDTERLMIHLKMEQLLAERNQQMQNPPDEMTACQKSMLASNQFK